MMQTVRPPGLGEVPAQQQPGADGSHPGAPGVDLVLVIAPAGVPVAVTTWTLGLEKENAKEKLGLGLLRTDRLRSGSDPHEIQVRGLP